MDSRGLIRATSYTEQAREVIKHLIFSGTYKLGEKLKEAELSKQLGISRSPVRARLRSSSKPGRARQVYEEHVAIYEALKERNVEKAEEAMSSHLRNGLESTLEILADSEIGVA